MKYILVLIIFFSISCTPRTEIEAPTGITQLPYDILIITPNGTIQCCVLMTKEEYNRIIVIYPTGIPSEYFDLKVL